MATKEAAAKQMPAAGKRQAAHRALRSATQAAHAALDGQLPLMSDDVERDDLLLYLVCVAPLLDEVEGHLARLEPALARAGLALDMAVAQQCRQRDLQALGATAQPPSAIRHTAREAFAVESRLPFWWGVLYVVIGSRLGGRIIGRHLQRTLQLTARSGLSYLLQPPSEPHVWRRLCALLDQVLRSEASVRIACRGALCCFAWFSAALLPMHQRRALPLLGARHGQL